MQYFDSSIEDRSFVEVGSTLLSEVDEAEPRLRSISDERAGAPRERGKWSSKQILGHLIDSATNNHQRFVRGQAVDVLRLPGYAQEHWVASQGYEDRPWEDLIDLWCAYNRHMAHVIARIPESLRATRCEIGDYAPVTLSYIALDYVGHIEHHLRQLFDAS
jgi:hypothetical protein